MQQPARILLLDRRLPSLAAFVPACTFHTDRFHGVAQADARRPGSFATKRRASAIDVKAGWEQFEVGKTALPTIYRLETPCTRQSVSTTPSVGDTLIRAPPIW